MNKAKNKFQQGFAVIEIAIFIVVITAVSGIGYWAVSKSKAATTASPNIASIAPTKGKIGQAIKFNPETKFVGHYVVNVKKVGDNGDWYNNIVRLLASADGKSLTKEDGSLWTIPKFFCPRDSSGKPVNTCLQDSLNTDIWANKASMYYADANTTWKISLTDSTNATGNPITGNKDTLLTVIEDVVPSPKPSPSPSPSTVVTPTPSAAVHPSISDISPSPAKIGSKMIVKKGTTQFLNPPYIVYLHPTGDASAKTEIAKDVSTNASKDTLEFALTNDISALIKNTDTDWGMQVKDSLGQYSNSYKFTIEGLAPVINVSVPKGSENYQQGDNILTVQWTTAQAISAGQFCVKVVTSTKTDASKCTLENANNSKSYLSNISLNGIPLGSGYIASVSWRPFHGGGAYGPAVVSPGYINIVAAPSPVVHPSPIPSPIVNPSPIPSVNPPYISPTPTPTKPWSCRYFRFRCPPTITPTPRVAPTPTKRPETTPTLKPTPKPWYCFWLFCRN